LNAAPLPRSARAGLRRAGYASALAALPRNHRRAAQECRRKRQQIKGVGISAQGKGLFLLDKQDQPLGNAILSSDRRALEIVQRWQQDGIPEKLYPHTRQTLWTGHPASLLRWVKENEPQRYAANWLRDDGARLSALVPDRRERLRREQHLRVQPLQHEHRPVRPAADALAGISEIDGALPPIVGSAEICGEITAQAAALTGLAAGTPVVGGLFDVVSTALCAGLQTNTRSMP
jgi:L-xylulokinase